MCSFLNFRCANIFIGRSQFGGWPRGGLTLGGGGREGGLWVPLVFCEGCGFWRFPARIFAVISSDPCTYKFTIDKRPDLQYAFACYLEQPSPTPRATPAVTLDRSYCCKLFVLSLRKKSSPLQSSKSRLFSQNTRGGVYPHISPLWNQQHTDSFFPARL
jgi:hypothetical protein